MAINGIAGKVYRNPDTHADPALVCRMLRAREGEVGSYFKTHAALAFPLEQSAGGATPVRNEDQTRVIAFSGELYNRADLQHELTALGHTFTTETDSEVALHAFEQWNLQVGLHLRGVFAFAVYDYIFRSLFLIRDRLGMKPLFYAHLRPGTADEAIAFASEVKSFLADPHFDRSVDIMALNHYLTFQYVPQPWSIFQGARKVEPGHWLTYRNGELKTERYWDLLYTPKSTISEADAVEQSLAHIEEALKVRLDPTKRVGVLLSGGVDSSSMVAMIRKHVPGDLHTFSVGFHELPFNELPYARQVAQQFGTKHEEYVVDSDSLGNLGEFAWYYDEPMADSSLIATYHVIKQAAAQVDVAFLGDGGDESFLGYERYRGIPVLQTYERIPHFLRAVSNVPLAIAAKAIPQIPKLELLSYVNKISLMPEERRYIQSMVYFREYQKPRLLAAEHRHVLSDRGGDSEQLTHALLMKHSDYAWAERKPYSDIMSYLPGALIPKVERAAVANGVACRAPILDERVMEFCAKLPPEMKLRDGVLKYVLKKGVGRYFTDEFLNRPKQGFGVPIGDWFRGPMRGFTEELLLSETARKRGFFDPKYVRRLFDQHAAKAQNHAPRIWVLMMFEAWCRTFLDRPDALEQGPVRIG